MTDANTFFRLDNKVALVTGGAQGIGEVIVRRLAAAGARVVIFDRNGALANQLAGELGGLGIAGDVTSESDVNEAAARVEREFGSLDILVNNAGITGHVVPVRELSKADFEKVISVNLVGPFLWCRAVIPGMVSRKFGRIINIASVAGKEGNPTLAPYSASKAGLMALTKSLAKELVRKGDITVNSVTPAVIQTPLLDGVPKSTIDYMVGKIPMGRVGRPEEVAAIVHYLASADASFTTGQAMDVSGGRSTF